MALRPLGITAVAQGVPSFVRDLGRMDSSISRTGGFTQQLARDFTNTGRLIRNAALGFAGAVTAAAGVAGAGIFKLAADAAPLVQVQQAFEGIAESSGVASDELLAALKRGSAGLITNRDLFLTFNKAAALVNRQFAIELPDALELISKASAATGESFSFLLDSYVRGVGRLTPLILDNLGVQVSLQEATEAYAKELGKSASELTRTEQQQAINLLTLQKLREAYEDLPGLVGTTTQSFGSIRVAVQDLRDEIGLALQPAFATLLDKTILPLVQVILPKLRDAFLRRIIPALERFVGFLDLVTRTALEFGLTSRELREAIISILPRDFQERIIEPINKFWQAFVQVRDFIIRNKEPIVAAITAIGVALAAAAIASTLLDIFNTISLLFRPFGILLALIGLFAAAWETNFLGIRDVLTQFWEERGREIFENIVQWIGENLPKAIDTLTTFWDNTLVPIFDAIRPTIERFLGTLRALFFIFGDLLGFNLTPFADEAQQALGGIIGEEAAQGVVDFIDNVKEFFGGLREFFTQEGGPFAGLGEGISGVFENLIASLPPGVQQLIESIQNFFRAAVENAPAFLSFFQEIGRFISETFGPTIGTIINNIAQVLSIFVQTGADGLNFFGQQWEFFAKVVELALAVVQNLLLLISGVITAWIALVTGDFEGLGEIVLGTITQFINNVLAVFDTNLPELADVWRTNLENLALIVTTIWDNIVTTVKEKVGAFTDSIKEGVNTLIEGVKNILGIQSPSKVFEDIGANIVAGLEVGMSKLPATQAVSAGRTVSTVTNNNFSMTVNSSAPTEQVAGDFAMLQALASRRR